MKITDEQVRQLINDNAAHIIGSPKNVIYDLANELSTLRAQNERLASALEKIAKYPVLSAGNMVNGTYTTTFDIRDLARTTLESIKRGEG